MDYTVEVENLSKETTNKILETIDKMKKNHDRIRRRTISDRCDESEENVQKVLSKMCENGILRALLELRCPDCTSTLGIYKRKSDSPDGEIECISCAEYKRAENSTKKVFYKYN